MSTTDSKTATAEDQAVPEEERYSFSDTLASLDGFEEDEIYERFGDAVGGLMDVSLSKASRALLFILQRRQGIKGGDAYKAAMSKRLSDVNAIFFNFNGSDEDEAIDADSMSEDPVTELGKADGSSD